MEHSPQSRRETAHHNEGPKPHLWAFFLSIVFTILAFAAVASEAVSTAFTIPFIIFLAVVQAAFQLFIWMHMNQKDHEFPLTFMMSGVFAAVVTVAGIILMIWW
ncbi:MAG: cytochrome C oxidase subunit IV family protein [Bacillaceae bacterium]|nr:cytochrome C oxidase subunit IV family protein [Bacillaceae bacterium]